MMPMPSAKYVGLGPLVLADLTHKYEGIDDIEFLAVQDAVSCLSSTDQERYRRGYLSMWQTRAPKGERPT